jgi:hypothetical protein
MTFANAQELLIAKGCTQTIHWSSSSQGRMPLVRQWSPDKHWNGSDTRGSYLERYGVYNEGLKGAGDDPSQAGLDRALLTAGTMIGERGIDDAVLAELPPGHVLSAEERQDLLVVKHPTEQRPYAAPPQAAPVEGAGPSVPPPSPPTPAPATPSVPAPAASPDLAPVLRGLLDTVAAKAGDLRSKLPSPGGAPAQAARAFLDDLDRLLAEARSHLPK